MHRWFEELCRIRHPKLADIVSTSQAKLVRSALPPCGGVYTFWWTGDSSALRRSTCNRALELHGPGGRPIRLRVDDEWLGIDTSLPIPLYVGKTAGELGTRIGQHLRLKESRMLPRLRGARKQARPTTSCQLRAGIEHLFPTAADTRTLILENLGLSYVCLPGPQHAANRFYLEDLAIGMMRPPLNVDVER
jgi:hypothetical protein